MTLDHTDAADRALLLELRTRRGGRDPPAMKTRHPLLLKQTLGGHH